MNKHRERTVRHIWGLNILSMRLAVLLVPREPGAHPLRVGRRDLHQIGPERDVAEQRQRHHLVDGVDSVGCTDMCRYSPADGDQCSGRNGTNRNQKLGCFLWQ